MRCVRCQETWLATPEELVSADAMLRPGLERARQEQNGRASRAAAPAIVRDVALFDVYHGKGLAESEKSLAYRIVMQDTQRTLEDAEVEEAIAGMLAVATRDFNASLRG